jgi:hypothetical protein
MNPEKRSSDLVRHAPITGRGASTWLDDGPKLDVRAVWLLCATSSETS